jgi:hypothetical protein
LQLDEKIFPKLIKCYLLNIGGRIFDIRVSGGREGERGRKVSERQKEEGRGRWARVFHYFFHSYN